MDGFTALSIDFKTEKGRAAAVTATARKLSVIFYHMMTKKEPYKPFDFENIPEAKTRLIKKLQHKLASLNLAEGELKNMFQALTVSVT